VHAHPLSLYLPSRTKAQIHSPYVISTPICTLWLGGVNDTANDVFTCAIDIGDQYSVNYVTDNNDIFVPSVDDTERKNWEQFVACINYKADNDLFKKIPWQRPFDDSKYPLVSLW